MKMTLEESFAKLESIANQMGAEGVALDLYEEGQALIRHCENLLNEAQAKIDQTTANAAQMEQ